MSVLSACVLQERFGLGTKAAKGDALGLRRRGLESRGNGSAPIAASSQSENRVHRSPFTVRRLAVWVLALAPR
jgi:hypothetical protein